MIEVKNLTKRYGNHTAVDNISFTIDKGNVYGFLGPNGAGKTTTMNILTGYLAATEGTISINGHDILKEPEEAKKSIGYLPDVPPVYMDSTVREYLTFVAELKGLAKEEVETQCKVAMMKLQLTKVADRLIGNLSKGYRQRVGLAQALLGFPETIILDEPMVGLDPQQIIEMRELIKSLAKNHTVILSSHILAEVQEICDYLLIISNGKLVAQDTPENLEKKHCCDETVYLEVAGELKEIYGMIQTVEGVELIESTAKDDIFEIKLTPKVNCDIREALFRKFAEHNHPLLSMYKQKPSLEEVYLKLVEKGASS